MNKTSNEPIPLKQILIEADIVQSTASLQMTQVYINNEDCPIESVFLFPMDVAAVVSKLTIDFTLQDGKKHSLETVIDEKEKVE